MGAVISEDLSKSEDKEDVKKESEDGKSAKKVDDSEVSPVFRVFQFDFSSSLIQFNESSAG